VLLFERALGSFWEEVGWGSFQDRGRPEQFHLVRHSEVEYRSPVRGVGRVRVRVGVERLGTSSLTFGFRMLPMDRDVDHATGRRTVVHVDAGSLRPQPWPEGFRQTMEPWLA
jgi:acyl-CoA thioester hydrolase